ncbi:MAG: M20/M25/M40 family metallo-hydrolase [Acidobacteriota bacterium]|nr:M20/M25/M40 family metallo-hydrolase [Acidobacteriota bacterium]
MSRRLIVALAVAAAIASPAAQQAERIDADVNTRIRKEGMENSQILATLHQLTDVFGPRLTGSPNHKAAAEWTVAQMTRWGFVNGKLEPWDFGRPGWLNERATGHIIAPVKDNLVFEVLAWTPSTSGVARGKVVHFEIPQQPTEAELTAFLNGLMPKMKGAIVLVGPHVKVPFVETEPAKRRTDESVRQTIDRARNPQPPAAPGPGRGGRQGGPPERREGALPNTEVQDRVDAFLIKSGALVRINDAGRAHGQIRAFNHRAYDPSKTIPTVVLRNEDYGRIARLAADGPVELEFTIQNKHFPEGKTSYNAVAEIRGTDKADEVVMLGGHLDSWHSATGATDNAIGCAVMMEAARILKAIGVQPRRTIRVALWGGEEQGLLGSKAYVAQHFGSFEDPLPEFAKFNGYFNVDSGTGRIRMASVFGPSEVADILSAALKPFEDFGIFGATATTSRGSGGTDSTTFNAAGIPGIGLSQDGIEYNSHTWHTNLDTYERIVEDDVKKSAVAIAAAVYHIAMRDEMLPRFPKEKMPPVPGARGGGPGQD